MLLLSWGAEPGLAQDPGSRRRARSRPFSFAVIADVQYGDRAPKGTRCYRSSSEKLTRCVRTLRGRRLDFVIQLGDLIEGYPDDPSRGREDLALVLGIYRRLPFPRHHVVGNHCLLAGKEALRQALGRNTFHHEFEVPRTSGWRFVVLDGNDGGYGVVGDDQLAWFRGILGEAKDRGERVLVFCHFAILKEAAPHCRMARTGPLLEALDEAGCVAAWFAGHDHGGGHACRRGVHHITMRGMVETSDTTAFAVVTVGGDRLEVRGAGREPSRSLVLSR